MKKLLCILLLAYPLFGQTTHTTASQEGNNTFTGTNTFGQIPVFSLGLGAVSASSVSVSGNTTLARIFHECWVDGVTYTTIASAYADTTNCKMVVLPPGYTETLAANLVLSRSSVPIVATGTATITMGTFQITSAGTVNGVSLVAPFCALGSGANQCFKFVYTGTSAAIAIGDSSTHSKSFYARGIEVDTSGNGAVGLQLNNLDGCAVENSYFAQISGSVPISIQTVGAGQFVGSCNLENVFIGGTATNGIGYQFQNLSTTMVIIGGNVALDSGASAKCVQVQGSGSGEIKFKGAHFNTCNTAVVVDNGVTPTGAVTGDFTIDSGVITVATYGTGTIANKITCDNCATNATYTDTGTNNSVEFPIENQVNSLRWFIGASSSASGFYQIQDRTDNSLMIDKQSGAATVVNSSTGNPVRFNSQSSGATGVEFHGSGAAVLVVDQNGTLHPAVAGAVGIGTTALPTKNLIIGNAATNNTSWAPVVTAARTLTSPDGNSSTVMVASLVTTAAASDAVTVTGATSSSHCSVTPTNASAATNIATTFVSTKAANTITVSHTATANMNYDLLCTSN